MPYLLFKKRALCTVVALASLGATASVLATPYGYADYGDAPSSYGGASSRTGDYQRLGNRYGTDDGVSWSFDGGATYGHAAATQGQTVKFKFDLFSHNIGGHVFDPVRAWFDANGNGQWAEEEMIFSGQYNKATNDRYDWKGTPENPGSNRHWIQGNSNDWIKTSFFTEVTISDTARIGESWLRVRATCDASIGGTDWWDNNTRSWKNSAGDINRMGPTGFLDQGETEDYVFTVVAREIPPVVIIPPVVTDPLPPAVVPEPSGLLLLGLGLLGLVTLRVRKLKAHFGVK